MWNAYRVWLKVQKVHDVNKKCFFCFKMFPDQKSVIKFSEFLTQFNNLHPISRWPLRINKTAIIWFQFYYELIYVKPISSYGYVMWLSYCMHDIKTHILYCVLTNLQFWNLNQKQFSFMNANRHAASNCKTFISFILKLQYTHPYRHFSIEFAYMELIFSFETRQVAICVGVGVMYELNKWWIVSRFYVYLLKYSFYMSIKSNLNIVPEWPVKLIWINWMWP